METFPIRILKLTSNKLNRQSRGIWNGSTVPKQIGYAQSFPELEHANPIGHKVIFNRRVLKFFVPSFSTQGYINLKEWVERGAHLWRIYYCFKIKVIPQRVKLPPTHGGCKKGINEIRCFSPFSLFTFCIWCKGHLGIPKELKLAKCCRTSILKQDTSSLQDSIKRKCMQGRKGNRQGYSLSLCKCSILSN